MPVDKRSISREQRRAILRVAEPRRSTSAAQMQYAAAVSPPDLGDFEQNVFTWDYTVWDTHVWGEGGKFVWG